MNEELDLRGLSCPEPIVRVLEKLNQIKTGKLKILVDTGTSRDNVTRIALKEGWTVNSEESNDECILTVTKE